MIDAIVKITGSILCLGVGLCLCSLGIIIFSAYVVVIKERFFEGK